MTMMRQLVPAALRLRSRSLSLGIALIAVATSWAVFAQETPVSDLAPQVETPPPPPVVVKPVISRDKGANAFLDVYRVLLHPRCMNCHPNGDVPLQTDASIPHTMNIVRDSANVGLPCSTCHRETMPTEANLPPGLQTWHMPPKEVPMVFEGKTQAQLCTQLKTPKETAGRDLDALVEHVEKDALVLYGWNPGPGRTLPPISHEDFVLAFHTWVKAGAPCPAENVRVDVKASATKRSATPGSTR